GVAEVAAQVDRRAGGLQVQVQRPRVDVLRVGLAGGRAQRRAAEVHVRGAAGRPVHVAALGEGARGPGDVAVGTEDVVARHRAAGRIDGERQAARAGLVGGVVDGDVVWPAQVEELGVAVDGVGELVVGEGVAAGGPGAVAAQLAEGGVVGGDVVVDGVALRLVELDRGAFGAEVVAAPGVVVRKGVPGDL